MITEPTMTVPYTTKRTASDLGPRRLRADNINPNVKAAKYAVRGELAVKAEEYRVRLAKGDKSLPFDSVIFAILATPSSWIKNPSPSSVKY